LIPLLSPLSLFLREEITLGFTDTAVQKWLLFLLFKHHACFFEVINGPPRIYGILAHVNVYLSVPESRKMLTTLVKQNPVFKKKIRKRTISLKNVPLADQG
jgi:hypothetical protein